MHWRQTGLKSGGAECEFETYLVKFETYSVIRDYETKKTAGAAEPPEPPSLAPMHINMLRLHVLGIINSNFCFKDILNYFTPYCLLRKLRVGQAHLVTFTLLLLDDKLGFCCV